MSTPMNNKTLLSLQGLTCMHCVGAVTKALEARSDVDKVKVTLNYAVIEGEASQDELIKTIVDDGYEAFVPTKPDTKLALSGLSCMKCAGKTQKALEEVEGVVCANVDTETAEIYGTASVESLIAAVVAIGYEAKVTENGAA